MADVERHPDSVDLAEYAEGLLDASRRQAVEDHVRHCADCTTVLTDLADVPDMLANAPLPPLPDDVAARIDQAIAAEATARASDWSGTAARAGPIRRTRRWLAPLAVAAAVIGVIAIAVPVVDNANDGDDAAGGGETSADALEQGAAKGDAAAPSAGRAPAAPAQPVPLSRATFGQDVIDVFYPDAQASALKRSPLVAETDPRSYYESQLKGQCPVDGTPTTSYGEVVRIVLDGQPAYLLLNHPGRVADAVAFTCDGPEANLLVSASLRLR
jgi:hypothetical protein